MFSFNHPLGACPTCRGFGRTITIDYNRTIPDRSKSLGGGAVKPWQVGHGLESQRDLARMCKARGIPMNVPFSKLPSEQQQLVIDGDPHYGQDEEHEWPRARYGIKGYFSWLESKAYKMHVRVLLSRYRAYTTCPDCHGKRFQSESLLYKLDGLTLADFYQLPVRDALQFVHAFTERNGTRQEATNGGRVHKNLSAVRYDRGFTPAMENLVLNDALATRKDFTNNSARESNRTLPASHPLRFALREVDARLHYLNEVGLGYLTLDRPTRSLSGGETERVNLTNCLGTRLVNTLFVLDEP